MHGENALIICTKNPQKHRDKRQVHETDGIPDLFPECFMSQRDMAGRKLIHAVGPMPSHSLSLRPSLYACIGGQCPTHDDGHTGRSVRRPSGPCDHQGEPGGGLHGPCTLLSLTPHSPLTHPWLGRINTWQESKRDQGRGLWVYSPIPPPSLTF